MIAVYRQNKHASLAKALASGVFDNFNSDALLKKEMKEYCSANMVYFDLKTNSLRERKRILDSLRCQQNEHLLGVLEEEQGRERMRQIVLQKIFDPREKVKLSVLMRWNLFLFR